MSNFRHGMYGTRTYHSWQAMRQRCLNPNNDKYKLYGGRGIKICKEWNEFENFYTDMGEAPKNKTLDRKDNNGNYEPNNCRWATQKEQMNNMRRNRLITYQGKTQNIMQWSRELEIKHQALYYRLNLGWNIKKILSLF